MPPNFKQITLIQSGVADLVISEGFAGSGAWYQRGRIGGKRSNGRTPVGALKIASPAYRPKLISTITAKVVESQLALFDRMMDNQQDGVVITCKNEFELVPQGQASWHNRTIVSGSSQTINGQQKCNVSYNCWIQREDGDADDRGPGWFLLQFVIEEL